MNTIDLIQQTEVRLNATSNAIVRAEQKLEQLHRQIAILTEVTLPALQYDKEYYKAVMDSWRKL